MISRWLLVCLSLCTLSAFGQSTTVSATITDSDGTVWANGTYTIIFTPNPAYPGTSRYIWSGGNLNTNPIVGTINGSGTFSLSLPSNTEITPAGSTWNFTICPNAIQKCQSINVSITGATQDLTAVLSAIALAPRFAATPGAYGYSDIEVSPTPVPGGTYFNTTSNVWRQWTGTAWQNINSGGAAPNPPAFSVQASNSGVTGLISTPNFQINTLLNQPVSKLPVVNVLHTDFGSSSGCANAADPTGATDSSCAINAALSYAGSLASFSGSRASVSLPIGTYRVSSPRTVPSNVRLFGDSTGASILSFSNASPVDAGISLSAVSGVEVDHINIQCASSPATCVRAVKVYNSTNVHIHDMQISGGGYASTSGPRAQIALFADDNVEIDRNQLTGSGGIYEIVSNEAGVGPVSTRLNIHDNTIQGNLAIISIGLFDAQYSRIVSNKVDENNQTDSTTHDGYGIMSYSTTVQSYPLASLSGSGTITAGVALSGGVSLLPAVGSRLFVNIAGVTGGTGTLNNGFEATVTSPTTVTYVCSGCNASGATITSATFSEPSAYNQTANNNIQNTAGSGIYFQGCMYCSTTGDILSNTVQQELATTLAAAAIAISAGNASSPIALGDTVTGPIINGSGQNGIEFTSSDGTSISGGSIRNVALNGIRIRNADTNFSIGGGITISNVLSCIQDQVSNGAGSIDGVLCSNPSFTGFNNATATPTGPRSISNFSCIGTTAIPCVFD